jgi:ABC-2 type transport system permease protein
MRYLRLIGMFIRAAAQQELAYRVNFWIHLLHSSLNLFTAVVGLQVLFGQVQAVRGWDFPATLALLGVYLTVSALRQVCLGPSLDALAGMDGELWTGRFDFTLLRPVDVQFLASFREWRPFALLDLALGLGVTAYALAVGGASLSPERVGLFLLALAAALALVYAVLLGLSALVFWSPGLLFTWVFDAVFQLARYPVGIYPPWLRLVLTWAVPVALITTVPAEALTGRAGLAMIVPGMVAAAAALVGSSWLFRTGARRYASASS